VAVQSKQKPKKGKKQQYCSIGQASKMLGVSIATLRRWEKAGKIKADRLDGKNRSFKVADLEKITSSKPLSTAETAKLLKVSESSVRRLQQSGELVGKRGDNGKYLFSQESIDSYKQVKATKKAYKAPEPSLAEMVEQEAEKRLEEAEDFLEHDNDGYISPAEIPHPFLSGIVAAVATIALLITPWKTMTNTANTNTGPVSSTATTSVAKPAEKIDGKNIIDRTVTGAKLAAGSVDLDKLSSDVQQVLKNNRITNVFNNQNSYNTYNTSNVYNTTNNSGGSTVSAGTGISVTTNGNDQTISANYGSQAGTAAEGNKLIICPTGSGNLTGGGNSVAVGAGGTCNSLGIVSNPSFTGQVTAGSLTSSGAIQFSALGTGLVRSSVTGELSTNFVQNSDFDSSQIYSNLSKLNNVTIGGQLTVSGLANGIVKSTAGVLSGGNTVSLGADTTGSYIQNLGTLTGLTTTGNTGAGSTPTISVAYGSTANTSVQGNTTLICPSGTGNLSGTGNTITLGSGGTCNSLSMVNNPTFSGLMTSLGVNAGTGSIQGTGGIAITGNSTITGTLAGLTGIASSGTITFSGLASGIVKANSSGALSGGNTVSLGADTTGSYIQNLGALTGLTTSGNTGAGSTPTLAVAYGSTANTSVQGNTTLICPSGTGNLSGTGNTITLGSGGTCNSLSMVNNPTFTGLMTSLGVNAGSGSIQGTGGIAITGNSTITGTLSGLTGLTVASGGASISGNSSITGALTTTSAINGANISGGTLSGGTFTGGSVSGGSLTGTSVNGLNVSSGTISSPTITTPTVSGGLTVSSGGASIIGGLNNNSGGITNAGAISGATGITSSGTITFSGLGAGVVQSDAFGVLSSSTLGVGSGGTGATTFTTNGILYGNGTSAIQATSAAANSILATNAANAPILTQTLPSAVQQNITYTGALSVGSITNGFGTISTSNNITTASTGGNALAVTGAPAASATSSLIRVGSAISGGNASASGGTYIGINAPNTGAGSAADFINFQNNGTTKLKVDSTGAITAATTSNTINGLVISSGALSSVTGYTQNSGNFDMSGSSGTFKTGTGAVSLNGNTTVKPASNSTTAFQIQNATGSSLLTVDTLTTSNLLTNGDMESSTNSTQLYGWSTVGTGTTFAQNTTSWQGKYGLSVAATAGNANGGASNSYTLAANTTYTLSFYARVNSGTITDLVAGRQDVSGTDITCLTGQTVTTSWTRYSCTFTTGTTITSSNIFIQRSSTAAETFLIDGVQLQLGSSVSTFNVGGAPQFSFNTSKLQVMNSTGTTNYLSVDTVNNRTNLGGTLITNATNVSPDGARNGVAIVLDPTTSASNVAAIAMTNGSSYRYALRTAYSGTAFDVYLGDNATALVNSVVLQPGTSGYAGVDLASSSGTQTNGFWVNRSASGGTTTNMVNIQNSAGTATNALTFTGTFTNLISNANFSVSNAGVISLAGGQSRDISSSNAIVIGPQNTTSGAGKGLTLYAGATSDLNTGGVLSLNGGNSTGGFGNGGAVTITGGAATITTGTGGAININGGSGITANGSVNVGTSTTNQVTIGASGTNTRIYVGATQSTNGLCADTTSASSYKVIYDCSGTPSDYAESYPVTSGIVYGDIVVTGSETVHTYALRDVNTQNEGDFDWSKPIGEVSRLIKSSSLHQNNTIGIVSNNYHDFTSAGKNIKPEDNPMPVALNGRVPVNMAPDSEPVSAGDYLTTSGTYPGKATKATGAGYVIGKALASWSSGQEQVMVFVEPGFNSGPSTISYIQDGGSGTLTNLTINGNLEVKGLLKVADIEVAGHIITRGNTPQIVAKDGAGAGATVSIEGNDTAGTITINSGSGTSAGDLAEITFAKVFGSKPRVILSASNDKAAKLQLFKTASSSGFVLKAADGSTPADGSTYEIDYQIMQ